MGGHGCDFIFHILYFTRQLVIGIKQSPEMVIIHLQGVNPIFQFGQFVNQIVVLNRHNSSFGC